MDETTSCASGLAGVLVNGGFLTCMSLASLETCQRVPAEELDR